MVSGIESGELQDLLEDNLKVVFVGEKPGKTSVKQGHYYSDSRNRFWEMLFKSGLTQKQIPPAEDETVLRYGYGLTDVSKKDGIDGFERKIKKHKPKIVCFNGLTSYRKYIEFKNSKAWAEELEYGPQKQKICDSEIFIVPSTSGAFPMRHKEKLRYFQLLKTKIEGL